MKLLFAFLMLTTSQIYAACKPVHYLVIGQSNAAIMSQYVDLPTVFGDGQCKALVTVAAKGGKPASYFLFSADKKSPYQVLENTLKHRPKIDKILLLQGESDAGVPELAYSWSAKWAALLQHYKEKYGSKNIQLHLWVLRGDDNVYPMWLRLREIQMVAFNDLMPVKLIDSTQFEHDYSKVHLLDDQYYLLAQAMK